MDLQTTEVQTLPQEVRKNGFNYTQVLRGKRSCIYRQRVTENEDYFEVFIIRVKAATIIEGKELTAKEAFPGNEYFGYSAWTYRDLKQAMIKFNLLEQGIGSVNTLQ